MDICIKKKLFKKKYSTDDYFNTMYNKSHCLPKGKKGLAQKLKHLQEPKVGQLIGPKNLVLLIRP